METSHRVWARETFGSADLGHVARTNRVVAMAATAATRPGGTIASMFTSVGEREGAYRLVESEKVKSAPLIAAMCEATIARCSPKDWVFIAVDGSSLSLTDRRRRRELGGVGNWSVGARGLDVVSALACTPDGTPIGLCAQEWWARDKAIRRAKGSKTPGRTKQTEAKHGLQVIEDVKRRFAASGAGVRPWLQLDRGFDAWPVLEQMGSGEIAATVRAAYNRCCRANRHGKPRYLLDLARKARLLGSYELDVPASKKREARRATLDARAEKVTIELRVGRRRTSQVILTVVHVKERGNRPDPLEWTLLTTFAVTTLEDAKRVVDGYKTRWRIEEFHRTWKRGGYNVEANQLHSFEAILKWATLLAAVAARATRLAYLARETPDAPALSELSRLEIDAAIVLGKHQGCEARRQANTRGGHLVDRPDRRIRRQVLRRSARTHDSETRAGASRDRRGSIGDAEAGEK
jgi:hypothetical protein